MDDKNLPENASKLEKAEEIIKEQALEIERLRHQLAGQQQAQKLWEAFNLAAITGTVAAPSSHYRMLEMIVEVAAQVISARAGALFLLDPVTQELVFEVAIGQKATEVKKFRVPLGHGIAGLVALSGQAMAISNAQQDIRQASDIAQAVGYQPQSILCVPLFYNDRLSGVLELLDKDGASSFAQRDIEILGLFAQQAAVAIEQSRIHRVLVDIISEALVNQGLTKEQADIQLPAAQGLANSLEEDETYREAFELAKLIQDITHQGEKETRACRAILAGFAEYLHSKPNLGSALGGIF